MKRGKGPGAILAAERYHIAAGREEAVLGGRRAQARPCQEGL
jgi:hypothetical protein